MFPSIWAVAFRIELRLVGIIWAVCENSVGAKRFFPLTPPLKLDRILKNCPTCEAESGDEYSFCNTCGTPLFLAPIDGSHSRVRKKRLASILAYAGEMLADIIVTMLSGV